MPEREGDGGKERAVSQAGCATTLPYFSLAGQWERTITTFVFKKEPKYRNLLCYERDRSGDRPWLVVSTYHAKEFLKNV